MNDKHIPHKIKAAAARLILMLGLILTQQTAVNSQTMDLIVEHYSTDNGLPSNTVYSTLRDKDGFMWLGTWYGLSSYDGTKFTQYVTRHDTRTDIPPRKVIAIVEDNTDNLWIRTTDNRLYRFDKTTERFSDMYSALRQVAPNLRVIKIQPMDNGHTLLLTRDKSLYEVCADKQSGNRPAIKPIYKSHKDIDRSTMRLRHNVLGETKDYIYWLGPNFEIQVMSKSPGIRGKNILRGVASAASAVTCICRIGNEVLAGTARGEIITINISTGKAGITIPVAASPINTISAINGQILISTPQGIYSRSGKLLAATGTDAESTFADKTGKLWLYGLAGGLTVYDPKSGQTNHFDTPGGTALDAVKFCDAGDNGLFILLRNGSVWRYDRKTRKMGDIMSVISSSGASQRILPAFINDFTAQTVSFSDIDIDADGLLWLSSTNNGLFKVRFPRKQFSYILQDLLAADIAPSNGNYGIRSLLQGRNGKLWIGTRSGNLYCVDMAKGAEAKTFHGSFGSIYNIMEDRQGNIWLSSKGGGLTKATPDRNSAQGMRFTTYRHDPKDRYSLSNDKVYHTFQDSNGRIWVCTYGGGLNMIAERNGKTVFINKNNELRQYPHDDLYLNVRQIAEDNNHTLWVATTDGLLSFSSRFGKAAEIRLNDFRQDDNPAVVDNDIYSILKDNNGNIWLSIFGSSLNRIRAYDAKSGKLYLETLHENGVQGNIVSAVAEDKRHRLWFTTENGLASIDINSEEPFVRAYGAVDGFMRSNIEDNCITCLGDGRILLGCREGIIAFDPDKVESSSTRRHRTFIVDFKVQNRSLESFSPAISQVSPRYAREIVLKHDQNMFSIEFATLNFSGDNITAYKYILDGYEREWHIDGNSRVASYANVPHGEYTFRVKPLNGSSAECTLRITVLPPWWLTWWAYTIYAILAGIAVYAGIRLALYMIRMRNEMYISDRLAELKIRFFTNVSHELRTPLTLIMSPISELMRHETLSKEGKEYLRLIDRNASRMLQLVNQILDFRKLQNGKMKLQLSRNDMGAACENITDEYRLAAKERNITLKLDIPEETVMAWCDAKKISTILTNLLSNAFKYTNADGHITVSLNRNASNGTCRISVDDDGAVIPEKQLDKIFERFSMADNMTSGDAQYHGTGIGLSLSKELAALHHGKLWAENNADGRGVTFTLEIPTGRDAFSGDDCDILFNDDMTDATVSETAVPHDATQSAEPQGDDPSRPTLVIVEDNDDLRRMLQLQLSHSYNVTTANDGVDGLEKVKAVHPDLIITDLMMPHMDGVALLKRIRQDFSVSHVPVIVLTAKNGSDDKMKAISTGANAFITKPFSHDMLMARIRQLLEEQAVFQRKMVLNTNAADKTQTNGYEDHLAKKDLQFIERIHSIIEENLNNKDFNIDTIAETIGLSRSAFFKKLKSLSGLAPVDLVREIRLDKAEKLVVSTDKSASEIAYEVGFKEASYFGKCFKKKFGKTPLEYRAANR